MERLRAKIWKKFVQFVQDATSNLDVGQLSISDPPQIEGQVLPEKQSRWYFSSTRFETDLFLFYAFWAVLSIFGNPPTISQSTLQQPSSARAYKCPPNPDFALDRPFFVLEPSGESKDASRQSGESSNGRVLQVGAPCHSAGRQFLLAHVDPKSGRVKKWTSGVKVYNFEARHVQDVDTFLGRKARPATNYMRDFDADEDNSKAEQKRLLATDFGSAKRMKMVQQAVKRHVKEETMESMVKSALTNVVDSSGQTTAAGDKKEPETSGITMIQQVTSTLLPVANEKAATPAAIYSLDTFITEEGMQSLSEEVDTFMKLTAKTALESELHVLPVASALHTVAKAYGAAPTDAKTFELAAKLYYLGCLAKVVRYVNKEARTRVQLRDVDFNNMRIANCAKMLISTHFFQRPAETTSRMRAAVYPMPKTSKDRLLAYTLCLAIILSPSLSLDVGYWCTALGVPDKRAKDLCRALGCNVAATKSSGGVMKTVATLLHTPLQASKQNAQKFGGRARK